MKTVVLIIRVLIGVIFLATSVGFFLNIFPEPVVNGDFKAFQVKRKTHGRFVLIVRAFIFGAGDRS